MKYFLITLLINLMLPSFSVAENILENACDDKIQTVLDLTIGTYYTENELDYDGLDIEISLSESSEEGYEYTVQFDDTFGWIKFSKDCSQAETSFIFGDKTLTDL